MNGREIKRAEVAELIKTPPLELVEVEVPEARVQPPAGSYAVILAQVLTS
jgi:hypothetical protein